MITIVMNIMTVEIIGIKEIGVITDAILIVKALIEEEIISEDWLRIVVGSKGHAIMIENIERIDMERDVIGVVIARDKEIMAIVAIVENMAIDIKERR